VSLNSLNEAPTLVAPENYEPAHSFSRAFCTFLRKVLAAKILCHL
jgi:hypothetical protein